MKWRLIHLILIAFMMGTVISRECTPLYENYNYNKYYERALRCNQADGPCIKEALQEIISNNTTSFSYGKCAKEILKDIYKDPSDEEKIFLFYTNVTFSKNMYGNKNGNWQIEHVWASSRGFGYKLSPPYGDLHNLRPCDKQVNIRKSDYNFAAGGKSVCLKPYDSQGSCDSIAKIVETGPRINRTFEPPTAFKGEVARIVFYMQLRYEKTQFKLKIMEQTTEPGATIGVFRDLKNWSQTTAVSDFESRINNEIYRYQGNRNPFIDNPNWVSVVFSSDDADYPDRGILPVSFGAGASIVFVLVALVCLVERLLYIKCSKRSLKAPQKTFSLNSTRATGTRLSTTTLTTSAESTIIATTSPSLAIFTTAAVPSTSYVNVTPPASEISEDLSPLLDQEENQYTDSRKQVVPV